MEKLFKLKENGTDVKTEVIAGITTFLAMAYILAVNPAQLGTIPGATPGAILTGTALSAAIATLCMAFFANYPVALASGMGLNAFFAFTVCGAMGIPYSVALTSILIEGIIFALLSLCKFREALINQIPANLKFGITAGIGLFITIIAMINAGIVINNDATLVGIGDFGSPQFVLSIVGLLVIGVLHHFKVPGSILLGILITWVFGIFAELGGWYVVDIENGVYSLIPSFSNGFNIEAPVFCNFDFSYITANLSTFLVVMFTFLYTDIFDTVGTLIGVAEKGNLLNEKGELPNATGALMADAVGTCVGAALGVSIVFSPIFLAIPSFATAPAMMFVGLLMLGSIKNVDFDSDIADTLGAFAAIVFMPLTYSIANGIMFGMLTWVILKVITGKVKDVKPVMWVTTALFAIYFVLKFMGIM